MTCIVGVVADGKVLIGGDSAGVSGLDLMTRADQKVFTKDGFAFGFTTSFRMGQLLRYALNLPKRHPDTDLMQYMVTDFIGAVRACLSAGGFATKTSEREEGGCFLVGHAGRLFVVHGDYQVAEAVYGYDSCGCGEAYAKGALFANAALSADKRVQQALEAAEAMSAGVRGPFVVVQA